MRILLVEDERRIREDVAAALEAAGYLVDAQGDGEEGWFLGDTESYGACVLDLGLPGMDGLAVLKRWREAGSASSTPAWAARLRIAAGGVALGANNPTQLAVVNCASSGRLSRTVGTSGSVG